MIRAGKRWAGRLGRRALRFACLCLSTAGSGLWFFPHHCADRLPGAPRALADEQQAPAFDPGELDALLEEVLGEAGTHD